MKEYWNRKIYKLGLKINDINELDEKLNEIIEEINSESRIVNNIPKLKEICEENNEKKYVIWEYVLDVKFTKDVGARLIKELGCKSYVSQENFESKRRTTIIFFRLKYNDEWQTFFTVTGHDLNKKIHRYADTRFPINVLESMIRDEDLISDFDYNSNNKKEMRADKIKRKKPLLFSNRHTDPNFNFLYKRKDNEMIEQVVVDFNEIKGLERNGIENLNQFTFNSGIILPSNIDFSFDKIINLLDYFMNSISIWDKTKKLPSNIYESKLNDSEVSNLITELKAYLLRVLRGEVDFSKSNLSNEGDDDSDYYFIEWDRSIVSKMINSNSDIGNNYDGRVNIFDLKQFIDGFGNKIDYLVISGELLNLSFTGYFLFRIFAWEKQKTLISRLYDGTYTKLNNKSENDDDGIIDPINWISIPEELGVEGYAKTSCESDFIDRIDKSKFNVFHQTSVNFAKGTKYKVEPYDFAIKKDGIIYFVFTKVGTSQKSLLTIHELGTAEELFWHYTKITDDSDPGKHIKKDKVEHLIKHKLHDLFELSESDVLKLFKRSTLDSKVRFILMPLYDKVKGKIESKVAHQLLSRQFGSEYHKFIQYHAYKIIDDGNEFKFEV